MASFYQTSMKIGGGTLFGRLAFTFLLIIAIAVGAATGLLFVYTSDLPQIRALEDYRPEVVTELYADDGQLIGSFALQRRILLTYEQIPKVLKDALLSTEDQHFEEHWGVDFPRVIEAAYRNVLLHRRAEGASTLTMQLARVLFLTPDKNFRRKVQETALAIQIERHYTKQQILAMYSNQIYLGHGNYGFQAASEFYFGHPVSELTLPEAALLAGIVRGPSYSPILHPQRARARRNTVLSLMARDNKITAAQAEAASQLPMTLHLASQRNDLAPYFVEELRQYLERTYGTAAVHEQGLRVYTSLNVAMQRAADQAVRDGLHSHDRRHGWRGSVPNIIKDNLGAIDTYQPDDWRATIEKGSYLAAVVTSVDANSATLKIGPYKATLTRPDFAWTGHRSAAELLKVGDVPIVHIVDISAPTAHATLEQLPVAQSALLAIDNTSGEIKAMVGGYSFEDSKFDRATQALRQTGSSFKVYVYATALQQGATPFDTIVDEPVTYRSGNQDYSPHNYDDKFEGRITLRRALADSRNVPAVRLAEKSGIQSVIDTARRFGITSPLPPYLPIALGAADLTLMEHTSAFTVFPSEGIRIEPTMIRRVTSYDGAVLEEHHPVVTDVIPPDVAHTMTAMLEDVVQIGTGVHAKELGRPSAGKTGTTNDFTDAWYIGFTPSLTAGVWVGNDDKRVSLGKKETGARAALPIWVQFMKQAMAKTPPEDFPNVVSLEQQATTKSVQVDTQDTAPLADPAEQGLAEPKETRSAPGLPAPRTPANSNPPQPRQR
jgi:penicillin-binding protein 1A